MSELIDVTGDARTDGVRRAGEALRDGELVVLPTDTRYGLAADAFNPQGTRRCFVTKRSMRRFPLTVLVRSPKQLSGISSTLPEEAERLIAAYWPGALTLVLRAEPGLKWDLGESEGTVAVRMPHDEVALAVIREVGPLAVTSANRFGREPARTAQDAREQFGDRVALYLDDGPRAEEQASTIVDLTRSRPYVLREGAIDADEVLAVAGKAPEPADAEAPEPADTEEAEPADAEEADPGVEP